MREVQRYSLVEVDRERSLCRVARDGEALGLVVTGVLLQAQFELADGTGLLLLTEGCPYDEGLHVYLIGRDDGLEDSLEAGAIFTPGILELVASGEDWLELCFFRNEFVYRLQVARDARLRMRLPPGWRYKRWWTKHRLSVTVAREGAP